MKFKKIFFLLLLIMNPLLCLGESWQRIEIIGANANGTRLALINSYFGPSSFAPAVALFVYEERATKPLLTDKLFAFEGDETAIKEMKEELISKNSTALKNLQIEFNLSYQPVNAMAHEFNDQMLIEVDDYSVRRRGSPHFQFKNI